MYKKFEKERKIISLVLILLAIAIITIMAVSILGKKSNAENNDISNNTDSQKIDVLPDGTSVNSRTNFEKTRNFGDYEISNMVFTSINNMTTITADVKNISQVKLGEKIVTLKLYDNQRADITSLSGMVKALEPNESTVLKITATLNYVDAYDYILSYQ